MVKAVDIPLNFKAFDIPAFDVNLKAADVPALNLKPTDINIKSATPGNVGFVQQMIDFFSGKSVSGKLPDDLLLNVDTKAVSRDLPNIKAELDTKVDLDAIKPIDTKNLKTGADVSSDFTKNIGDQSKTSNQLEVLSDIKAGKDLGLSDIDATKAALSKNDADLPKTEKALQDSLDSGVIDSNSAKNIKDLEKSINDPDLPKPQKDAARSLYDDMSKPMMLIAAAAAGYGIYSYVTSRKQAKDSMKTPRQITKIELVKNSKRELNVYFTPAMKILKTDVITFSGTSTTPVIDGPQTVKASVSDGHIVITLTKDITKDAPNGGGTIKVESSSISSQASDNAKDLGTYLGTTAGGVVGGAVGGAVSGAVSGVSAGLSGALGSLIETFLGPLASSLGISTSTLGWSLGGLCCLCCCCIIALIVMSTVKS